MSTERKNLLVMPSDLGVFSKDYECVHSQLPQEMKPIAEAFRFSLEGVSRTLSLPYRVVHLILLPGFREEFRSGFRDAWSTNAKDSLLERLQAITESMSEYAAKLKGETIPEFRGMLNRRANEVIEHDDLQLGIRELFLQAIVLIWSGFEVLAHDLFVWWLNRAPEVSVRLLENEKSKKYFRQLQFDLSSLAEEDFDLSAKMGQLIAGRWPLASLSSIRTAYQSLLPECEEVQRMLKNSDLWTLAQQRNLIVHRRGIVDQDYLANTSDSRPVGQRLEPTLDEVREFMSLVMRSGLCLLEAVAREIETREKSP